MKILVFFMALSLAAPAMAWDDNYGMKWFQNREARQKQDELEQKVNEMEREQRQQEWEHERELRNKEWEHERELRKQKQEMENKNRYDSYDY